MHVLFLHGWQSVCGGVKPSFLVQHGHQVTEPQLDDDDFAAALRMAQTAYNDARPEVIVGSSRGGALAMNLTSGNTPMVLICPAWKRWGWAQTLKRRTVILHSRSDEVIPFTDSEELIAGSGLPRDALIETGSDHRLSDPASLAALLWACELCGSEEQLPWLETDAGSDRRLRHTADSQQDAAYVCGACGEEIVIPIDLSEGNDQTSVEDCPVCCRSNVIVISIDDQGQPFVRAELEQD